LKRLLFNLGCGLSLLLCAAALATWPWSYRTGAVASVCGYTIAVDYAGIYLLGPDVMGTATAARTFPHDDMTVEYFGDTKVQRWKPMRRFLVTPMNKSGYVLVISNWFAVSLLALPPALWYRNWRRRRRNAALHGRGFSVESASPPNNMQ
jgi:hypothetical protein